MMFANKPGRQNTGENTTTATSGRNEPEDTQRFYTRQPERILAFKLTHATFTCIDVHSKWQHCSVKVHIFVMLIFFQLFV